MSGSLQQLLRGRDLRGHVLVVAETFDERLRCRRAPSSARGTSPCPPGRRGRRSRPSTARSVSRRSRVCREPIYRASLSAFLSARGAPPPLALARRLRAALGPQALSTGDGRQERHLVAILQRGRPARVLFVDRARRAAFVAGERRVTTPTSASHASVALAPSAAPAAARRSRPARAAARTAGWLRACALERRLPRRLVAGSAVAPSIQTSPPSKCSCFQIGAICFTRSIA